jgi:hypothetical protein
LDALLCSQRSSRDDEAGCGATLKEAANPMLTHRAGLDNGHTHALGNSGGPLLTLGHLQVEPSGCGSQITLASSDGTLQLPVLDKEDSRLGTLGESLQEGVNNSRMPLHDAHARQGRVSGCESDRLARGVHHTAAKFSHSSHHAPSKFSPVSFSEARPHGSSCGNDHREAREGLKVGLCPAGDPEFALADREPLTKDLERDSRLTKSPIELEDDSRDEVRCERDAVWTGIDLGSEGGRPYGSLGKQTPWWKARCGLKLHLLLENVLANVSCGNLVRFSENWLGSSYHFCTAFLDVIQSAFTSYRLSFQYHGHSKSGSIIIRMHMWVLLMSTLSLCK